MDRAAATSLVTPLYTALDRPAGRDVRGLIESVTAPGWRSLGSAGAEKGRDGFIALVEGLAKAIPDLQWRVVEVLADDDRIMVRSEFQGTPAGAFMGVPHSGRTFKAMALDLHTVKDGKLVLAHHVEDWAAALGQLAGTRP